MTTIQDRQAKDALIRVMAIISPRLSTAINNEIADDLATIQAALSEAGQMQEAVRSEAAERAIQDGIRRWRR